MGSVLTRNVAYGYTVELTDDSVRAHRGSHLLWEEPHEDLLRIELVARHVVFVFAARRRFVRINEGTPPSQLVGLLKLPTARDLPFRDRPPPAWADVTHSGISWTAPVSFFHAILGAAILVLGNLVAVWAWLNAAPYLALLTASCTVLLSCSVAFAPVIRRVRLAADVLRLERQPWWGPVTVPLHDAKAMVDDHGRLCLMGPDLFLPLPNHTAAEALWLSELLNHSAATGEANIPPVPTSLLEIQRRLVRPATAPNPP